MIPRRLRSVAMPSHAPASMTAGKFIELMSVDKKVMDGVLRLVLMKGIGKALVTDQYTVADLNETIKQSVEAA